MENLSFTCSGLSSWCEKWYPTFLHPCSRWPEHGEGPGPARVLCLGSGAGRLAHFLQEALGSRRGFRVVARAAVPAKRAHTDAETQQLWTVLNTKSLPQSAEEAPLESALESLHPHLIICSCMPPSVDWTRTFRALPSLVEYLLVGPRDSSRSGHVDRTWGSLCGESVRFHVFVFVVQI